MIKILTIIGARPQFIKAAVVSRALAQKPGVEEVLIHTGQHFDDNMSRVFFQQMQIPEPRYHLGIHSLTHGAMTGRMLIAVEEVALAEKPDVMMVYGDTNSTLAGALVASKLQIPLAHVEAGLRSFDMTMPEEVNRILTDRVSTLLFCPTVGAKENLIREGFSHYPCQMMITGDVMLDAAIHFQEMALPPDVDIPAGYIMVTFHRQSNTDNPEILLSITQALRRISEEFPLVVPLHPRTVGVMRQAGISLQSDRITVIPPVGYLESLWLLSHSRMVITDSGGLQKEAYFFGKACVTLRPETEWTELVDARANITAGTGAEEILRAFHLLKDKQIIPDLGIYGSGNASRTIAETLAAFI